MDDPHAHPPTPRAQPATEPDRRDLSGPGGVPERYVLRRDEEGPYLVCLEAPEVAVRVERGLSISAAAARRAPEGTIYLDGAAQGEPFLDLDRGILNLDHHEGCVRPFTLATSEQALVLVTKGLDLREKPWTVIANDPDLDALLAIWVLLNALHLRDDAELRRRAARLVHVEGLIDVHGFDMLDLAGLPEELLREVRGRIDQLRRSELEIKKSGRWGEIDLLEHTAAQLKAVDRMLYPNDFFAGFAGFEELVRVEIASGKIAVVGRSAAGIYELERDLKRLYGARLGVIALAKDERNYTLRRVDPLLPCSLDAAYEKLNLLDPAVGGERAAGRWGGSAEIGGSPRGGGTTLTPQEIAEALGRSLGRTSPWRRAFALGRALSLGFMPLIAGAAAAALVGSVAVAVGVALVAALVLLTVLARPRPHFFGLRRPRGMDWLLLTPAAVLGGLLGGAWGTPWPRLGSGSLAGWGTALALPLVAEIVTRGLTQGLLLLDRRAQHPGGRWFVSLPTAVSALPHVVGSLGLAFAIVAPGPVSLTLTAAGAVLLSLASGMVRERSGSLAAPIVLHYLAAASVAVLAAFTTLSAG